MAKKSRGQRAEGRRQNAEGRRQNAEAEARTYEVGTWAGLPQWRCLLCGFDTLDEQAMLEHAGEHAGSPQRVDLTPEQNPPLPFPAVEGGEEEGVFEVELKEIGSTVDEQGNEHKTFTVKE